MLDGPPLTLPAVRQTGGAIDAPVVHDGPMATLKEQLQADLTVAMKARDELAVSTLRMVRAALLNAEVAGKQAVTLTDEQAISVLRSEAKKRAESAEIYAQAGRHEAAAKERAEQAVIERYLPAAMSDDALAAVVTEEIAIAAAAGHDGQRAMGVVVKAVRQRAPDADGSKVAQLVKAALTAG
jgi:uncharacterized protein